MTLKVLPLLSLLSVFLLDLYPWKQDLIVSQSLNGNWTLRSGNGSIATNAQVPGSVHLNLFRAGIIPDPYFRYNDVNLRWVQRQPWLFQRPFVVSEAMSTHAVKLVCDGIDTVASIRLNGVLIANVSNQFKRHILDVTRYIKAGNNTLSIEIASAVEYGASMYQKIKEEVGYPVPPSCPPPEQHPECHANMVRKEQASFGWDWGPAFVTQGIWKDINLVYYKLCRILDVVAQPVQVVKRNATAQWNLNVTSYIECSSDLPTKASLEYKLQNVSGDWKKKIRVKTGENVINFMIINLDVEPWWPRGHGSQTLYTLVVTLVTDNLKTQHSVRTGFRNVSLVQEKLKNGLGFHFILNGRPIFMKGSNWIPADSFQDRIDKARIRHLLKSAVDANMNTLRVWGGGIYESDYFYDLADEYGLMIWQDFMFACAMYPATDDFLDSVKDEVQYQLRRLASHPSIIAWSGNNENEGAIVDNWYNTTGSHFPDYLRDYKDLYKGLIEKEVKSMVQVPFLLSSPSNGALTEAQGGVSQRPEPSSPFYGDVHYYNYQDDCMNLSIYPRTRFASEYGWQSWPSFNSLRNISQPGDLRYKSEFFTHREHHTGAGEGTDQMIKRHFHWPNNVNSLENGFKKYIYLTQVAQAMCYRAETEFYRRGRGNPDMRTMGALYWQLNEIWQAPSWSTIEYSGGWKMAHYHARHFFSDVLLSTFLQDGKVMGYAINDLQEDLHGYVVDLFVYNWDMLTWTSRIYHNHTRVLKGETVSKVFEIGVSKTCADSGLGDPANGFFMFHFWRPYPNADLSIPRSVQYLVPLKDAKGLKDPKLKVLQVEQKDNQTFTIRLGGQSVAPYVWLEAEGIKGRFSDNGFIYHTVRSYHHHVDFYSWQAHLTSQHLQEAISITSLWDTINPNL